MKKFLLVIFAVLFLCGGVLPAVEDYLDQTANSKVVLAFFDKKDSPEKIRRFIADTNKKLSSEEIDNIVSLIESYSQQFDVDDKLVAALIGQESKFSATAKSRVGALGLMQIMPATGRGIARKLKLESYNLTNPRDNIQIGVKYLSMLRSEYKDDFNLMLAHYNGGYKQAEIYRTFKYFDLGRLIFMSYETYDYVKKVKANYRRLSREF